MAGDAGHRRPSPASGRSDSLSCMQMPDTISVTPLWMHNADLPAPSSEPLPSRVDVLVVGAGYTGLSAARETARAGRSTLVLDAGEFGAGCSSRNGGQVGYSIKPPFHSL